MILKNVFIFAKNHLTVISDTMKNGMILISLCLWIALAFLSCGKEHYPHSLSLADSLTAVSPSRARMVLKALEDDTMEMTKPQRMYYKLLRLKADVEANVVSTSRVTTEEILRYYEKDGDRRMLSQAYYYAACLYRNINDAPLAFEYYQKTIETMPEDGDSCMMSHAYNGIGKLFLSREMDDMAYKNLYLSYKIDSTRKDTLCMVYGLRDLSMACEYTNIDRCLQLLREARRLNDKACLGVKCFIDERLSAVFLDRNEYDSAWVFIQSPLKNISRMDSNKVYHIASDIYFYRNDYDSASYFCHKLMHIGSIYAKEKAARQLAQICIREGEFEKGIDYLKQCDAFEDSIERLDDIQTLKNANSLYNLKINKDENNRLRIERKNYIITALGVSIFSCALISLLILLSIRHRQKQQRLRLRIFLLTQLENEHHEKTDSEIKMKKREIERLSEMLESGGKQIMDLERQVEEQKAKLCVAIENNRQEITRRDEQRLLLLKSNASLVAKQRLDEGKPIRKTEWKKMNEEIETLLPNFKYVLYQAYDLSEQEYHICLLLKMGFKNAEIGILISRAANAVSQARKRLYKKITGKDGSASDFDELIRSL